ncbi:MAG: DUF123 domain-containing protein [bacterium]|nr:DUF123 domain-containing protein [bacterium]
MVILGDNSLGGAYVLRIRLARDVRLRFGRFRKGKVISLAAGEYVYVGSARSRRGAMSLSARLMRHASRSGKRRSHGIRKEMAARFEVAGLGVGNASKREKRLRWNVDYLMDVPAAELVGVYVIRSGQEVERELGKFVEEDPHTVVFEKGLGANDVPGNTHLLRVDAGEVWWVRLSGRLCERFGL